MTIKLTVVYAVIAVFNILFCVTFYASQWVPIVSLSLHPQMNECGGLQTFADVEFLKLFLVQVALSVALQFAGKWGMTNSVRHLQSLATLVAIPFFTALAVLKLEPLFVDCVV